MNAALYNEIEPYACNWLDNLIAAGHIARGRVEGRSIAELVSADVAGSGQRHFFAGIGVWSYALRLAGVPDDADVWTGSCPCQPFSGAGKRRGTSDERHLWPTWFELIRECRPPVVFGEQVASPDGLAWLDAVQADLEGAGYAVGAADLCAAGVGAPHIRQRLYFVAHADGEPRRLQLPQREPPREDAEARGRGEARGSGNAGLDGNRQHARELHGDESADGTDGADTSVDASTTRGFWRDADWVPCLDGRARPVEPGTFPLAHGAPSPVGRLRAYGNAIVSRQASTFIRAALDAIE